jgi:MFS family permease
LNRRFVAYLFAAATADAGFWIAQVAQGWLVLKLTDSPVWLGLIAAATQVPFLLFSLPGGEIADRFNRRRVIASTSWVTVALAATTGVFVASGSIAMWLLAILGFLLGTCSAIAHPADRAWVVDLVGREHIVRAISLSSLEWASARTIGPAIGGLAIGTIGIAACYGAYAVCVLPLIALATVVRTTNARSEPGAGHDRAPGALRSIIVFSAFTAVFTIGITPYVALLPDLAKHTFGQNAAGYGALAAADGAGAIGGAIFLSWRGVNARKGRVAIASALLGALLLLVFAHTHSLLVAGILLAAMGAVDTMMYTLTNTYVQAIAGAKQRGRANAIFALAFLGGIPLGNASLGLLAGHFGTQATLGWSATIVAAFAVLFWFAAPTARDAA